MNRLAVVRRRFQVIATVLAFIALSAAGYLLFGSSRAAQEAEFNQLRRERDQKRADVAPLTGMDQKLAHARTDIDEFYRTRLPAQQSDISAELDKLARASGVRLNRVGYESKPADVTGLQQVMVTAEVSGGYVELVKFINALERDQILFIPDSVDLNEDQGTNVRLALKVQAYMRTGGAS
jgi:Tfp pilus assembly protein PilO